MKRLLISGCMFFFILIANNAIAQEKVNVKDDKVKVKDDNTKMKMKGEAANMMYPYTANYSSNFAIGNPAHAKLVLDEWKKKFTQSVDRGLHNQFHLMVAAAFPEAFVKFLFYVLIGFTGIFFSQKPQSEIIALLPVLGTFVVAVSRFLPSIYVILTCVCCMYPILITR